MQAALPLLSFLLILIYHSRWTHGHCKLENSTTAWCNQLEDLKHIETHSLESLSVPIARDVLVSGLFNNLTSLRHLDLSDGDLKKIEPGSFRTLSNLKSLNLGDNRIEYLELASLEGLTHLRSLNLRKNVIHQLPPALARLKNLKHLDIHGNPLECNCATLKVRDLIAQRGVTMSKKTVCAGPGNMKGTLLMKPSAAIICSFEQQDQEMQNDQAEGSGDPDLGSGDVLNEISEEEEDEEEDEYVEVNNSTSEKSREPEVETPFPTMLVDSTTESLKATTEETTGTTTNFLQHNTEDEEIFFDNEDKKEQTTEMSRKKEDIKDALFYPTVGSGEGNEGSGEGSGAGAHYDEEETEKADTNEESEIFTGTSLWSMLFDSFTGTSATTSNTKDPDLEEEQFIDMSSTKLATEETIVPDKSHSVESDIDKITTEATTKIIQPIPNDVVVMKPSETNDESKSGNIMDRDNNEQAVSSPKQSKKGMGSYVVLAVLLAIVAALIGFAAYRGEICRKRKPPDVEAGTEMKEIQKSLLENGENSTQPKKDEKIASYVRELESVPLMKTRPGNDAKIDEIHDDDDQTQETPRVNGTVDHSEPVKPPRKQLSQDENAISHDDEASVERPRVDVNSLKKNFLEDKNPQPSTSSLATTNGPTTHVSEPNGPPLSPGAQRVKITLQEIPDSVPKTPILITRTMAGENLVKTP